MAHGPFYTMSEGLPAAEITGLTIMVFGGILPEPVPVHVGGYVEWNMQVVDRAGNILLEANQKNRVITAKVYYIYGIRDNLDTMQEVAPNTLTDAFVKSCIGNCTSP
jgi:hypothetical protein